MSIPAQRSKDTQLGYRDPATSKHDGPDQPRHVVSVMVDDPVEPDAATTSLSALVRTWLSLTATAETPAPSPPGGEHPAEAPWSLPVEDLDAAASGLATVMSYTHRVDPAADRAAAPPVLLRPGLPALPPTARPERVRRVAVLIDAETTSAGCADALFATLAEHGTVTVSRAYADWTKPMTRPWSASLREHGVQPHHHFGEAGDQRGLIALTIDAVDLAREAAVDVVVIVGDLASVHPLVIRLNAAGLQVVAFGTTETPADVQALCHEFVPVSSLTDAGTVRAGRHRA